MLDLLRFFESAVVLGEGDDLYVSLKFTKPEHLSRDFFKALAQEFVADLLIAADIEFDQREVEVSNGA